MILFTKSSDMLNKDTLGVKKCEANQKQHANRQVRPKVLLLYQKYFSLSNIYNSLLHIFHDWLCHLATFLYQIIIKVAK